MLRSLWLRLHPPITDTAPPPVRRYSLNNDERDKRTGSQWLRSTLSYLEFRAGLGWRSMSDRWNQDRLDYLAAICQVQDVMNAPLPCVDETHAAELENSGVKEQPGRSRLSMADELLRLDPSLTDKKILLHLPRPKLARMVADARENRRAALGVCA